MLEGSSAGRTCLGWHSRDAVTAHCVPTCQGHGSLLGVKVVEVHADGAFEGRDHDNADCGAEAQLE